MRVNLALIWTELTKRKLFLRLWERMKASKILVLVLRVLNQTFKSKRAKSCMNKLKPKSGKLLLLEIQIIIKKWKMKKLIWIMNKLWPWCSQQREGLQIEYLLCWASNLTSLASEWDRKLLEEVQPSLKTTDWESKLRDSVCLKSSIFLRTLISILILEVYWVLTSKKLWPMLLIRTHLIRLIRRRVLILPSSQIKKLRLW